MVRWKEEKMGIMHGEKKWEKIDNNRSISIDRIIDF
jgi:hypothetical protein